MTDDDDEEEDGHAEEQAGDADVDDGYVMGDIAGWTTTAETEPKPKGAPTASIKGERNNRQLIGL